jgi:hypothetical protein
MNVLGDPVANRRAETTFPGVTVKEAQKGQKIAAQKIKMSLPWQLAEIWLQAFGVVRLWQ